MIFNANRINRWFLNSAAPLSFRQFPIYYSNFHIGFMTLRKNNKCIKRRVDAPATHRHSQRLFRLTQESNPACTLQYRVPTRYTMQVRDGIYNIFELLVSEKDLSHVTSDWPPQTTVIVRKKKDIFQSHIMFISIVHLKLKINIYSMAMFIFTFKSSVSRFAT